MVKSNVPPDATLSFWRELASSRDPAAFFHGWLDLQCRTLDGVTGGVLVLEDARGRFTPAARWPESAAVAPALAAAAERALRDRRTVVLEGAAAGTAGDPRGSGAPARALALPILSPGGRGLHGVVALAVTESRREALEELARRLDWGCAWLQGLLGRSAGAAEAQPAAAGTPAETAAGADAAPPEAPSRETEEGSDDETGGDTASATGPTVEDAVAEALALLESDAGDGGEGDGGDGEPPSPGRAAASLVRNLSRRAGGARVSVGLVECDQNRLLETTAGLDRDHRQEAVRAIESAMDEALDQGIPVSYPPLNGAVQINRAHEELARRHGAAQACSFPLRHGRRIVGVLTIEHSGESAIDDETVRLCKVASSVAGPILDLERRESRSLLARGCDSLRCTCKRLVGPRHYVLKASAILAAAAVLFFCFARTEYRISAQTAIEGSVQRVASAPFDGFIESAPVRAGDTVRKGDVLCVLEDHDLRLEKARLTHRVEELSKKYNQALATRDKPAMKITRAQIEQAKAQLELVADELGRTRIRAPMDALVVAGDLSQSIGSPVKRGDVLFQLAPLEGYRVILEVDERDISDVEVDQRGELLLSAFPTRPLPLRIEKVTPVSSAREGRNYFRVEAAVDGAPAGLRPGMEGIGKVEVGRRLLIWIWTHRAIDWVRLTLWSWLP